MLPNSRARLSLILVAGLVAACQPAATDPAAPSAAPAQAPASTSNTWLQGSLDERFEIVANQLRGLDMAMVEMGYRYQELFWAGENRNWAYAGYQTDKIRQTLTNALQRRPKREPSAKEIFLPVLDKMAAAVSAKDLAQFKTEFDALTGACNSCHVAESVPSFVVVPPAARTGPIR
jgi:hypothetical protein